MSKESKRADVLNAFAMAYINIENIAKSSLQLKELSEKIDANNEHEVKLFMNTANAVKESFLAGVKTLEKHYVDSYNVLQLNDIETADSMVSSLSNMNLGKTIKREDYEQQNNMDCNKTTSTEAVEIQDRIPQVPLVDVKYSLL